MISHQNFLKTLNEAEKIISTDENQIPQNHQQIITQLKIDASEKISDCEKEQIGFSAFPQLQNELSNAKSNLVTSMFISLGIWLTDLAPLQ